MPVAVNDQRLAASLGSDTKRLSIRQKLAEDFFITHIFQPEKNWQLVRRALQTIDYAQPIVVGPFPPAPKRVAALPKSSALGAGFFAIDPPKNFPILEWWLVAPEAPYMRWAARFILGDGPADDKSGRPSEGRIFIPAARTKTAARLLVRDRS
ncbi:MAG: hypothetical protein U0414_13370 [Polyangiaceae bacterium]